MLSRVGIQVVANEDARLGTCDTIFVCVPYNQLTVLQRSIVRDHTSEMFLVPYVTCMKAHQVANNLNHRNILKTDYLFHVSRRDTVFYDYGTPYPKVSEALHQSDILERLFPYGNTSTNHVSTTTTWVKEAIIVFFRYALRLIQTASSHALLGNYGSKSDKNATIALNVVNTVLFNERQDLFFTANDLRISGQPPRYVTHFEQLNDLVDIAPKMTYLEKRLSSGNYDRFLSKKFKGIFITSF